MIEVLVESVRVNTTNQKRVVMLKEKAGPRYIPIWIGHFEADAIAIHLQDVPVARPLAHDLIVGAVRQLGGMWVRAEIRSVCKEEDDNLFFAGLVVGLGDREVDLDSRPSDALAVAIRAGIPVLVAEDVLDHAGVVF